MTFNVRKPFGTICGHFPECPTAKYEQGGKFYDVNRDEIKLESATPEVKEVPVFVPPVPTPAVKAVTINSLKGELLEAQSVVADDPSPANRGRVTRIENKIKNF